MQLVLLIAALVLFILAGANVVVHPRVNLGWIGAACAVGSVLVTQL